jgi:transposase-like protein
MKHTSSPIRHYKQKIGLTTTTFRKWRRTTMRGRRTTPGTAATNFHGRARVKRLRLRKLQRQARQVGRGLRTRRR